MTSAAETVIDALKEALAAVGRSSLPHLHESGAFVSWMSVSEQETLSRIVAEERSHGRMLVDAILEAGGYPQPVTTTIDAAGAHYLSLHYLVPQIVRDKSQVIASLEALSPRLAEDAAASAVVGAILGAQRAHLSELRKLVESRAPAATR